MAGFTLIEALVALSIFSFIGVAAYQLLSSTGRLQQSGDQRFAALAGMQAAMRLLDEDFSQYSPRGTPSPTGGSDPALDAEPGDSVVEFTRAGWRNPLGVARSGLQRVSWLIDDDERLVRRFRSEFDNSDPSDRVERVIAEGVEEMELRYLDDKDKWQEQWPPPGEIEDKTPEGGPAPEPVPRAVEVRLVQRQLGEVVRVIPLR